MNNNMLIIDQEQGAREKVQRSLEEDGHATVCAGSISDALVEIYNHTPAMIFVGLRNRISANLRLFCQQLKKDRNLKLVPIVLMASHDMFDKVKVLIRQGLADDFLKRPVKCRDLCERTEILLAQSAFRRANRNTLLDSFNVIGDLASSLKDKNQQLLRQLKQQQRAYIGFIHALVRALESKDSYTAHHSARVTKYALRTAQQLGMARKERLSLKRAAMLHDIGKIGINLSYINKQGPLSPAETKTMRLHPVLGEKILAPLGDFQHETRMIKHHHERWDGNGYPFHLKRNQICLLTGIISVCDAYDAMTSDRSYRKGMGTEKALTELARNREKQFHPEAVDGFLAAHAAGRLVSA